MRVLPSGTQVSGTINANGREISFAGRIAWSRPGNAQMNIRGQMGVSFAKVPSEFVEMLETNTKRP